MTEGMGITFAARSSAHRFGSGLPAAELGMVLTILAPGHISTAAAFKETTGPALRAFQLMNTWENPEDKQPRRWVWGGGGSAAVGT